MHAFGFVMTEEKENVHLVLAPYNETDEDFFEYQEETDFDLPLKNGATITVVKKEDVPEEKLSELDAYYQELSFIPRFLVHNWDENLTQEIPLNQIYKGEEGIRRFALDYLDLNESPDDDGFGTYYNHYGFYDFYEIGGRWENFLPIKPEYLQDVQARGDEDVKIKKDGRAFANALKVKEVDFDYLVQCGKNKIQEAFDRNKSESANDDNKLTNSLRLLNVLAQNSLNHFPNYWIDEEGMEEMQEEDEFLADIKERLSDPVNQEKWITLVDFHY